MGEANDIDVRKYNGPSYLITNQSLHVEEVSTVRSTPSMSQNILKQRRTLHSN